LNLHFLLSLPTTSTFEPVDATSIPVVEVVYVTEKKNYHEKEIKT